MYDRFPEGNPVDADVQEAADYETQYRVVNKDSPEHRVILKDRGWKKQEARSQKEKTKGKRNGMM